MHGYWHAVIDSFVAELAGSRGFSLIPPEGLSMVVSVNPRLLLPSKSVVAYARKQSRSVIFEWDAEKKGWFWHAGNYPPSWEKKVKVINLPVPSKKAPANPSLLPNPSLLAKPSLLHHCLLQVLCRLAGLMVAKGKLLLTPYLPLNRG